MGSKVTTLENVKKEENVQRRIHTVIDMTNDSYHLLNNSYVPGTVLSTLHKLFNPRRHFYFLIHTQGNWGMECSHLALTRWTQEMKAGSVSAESAGWPARCTMFPATSPEGQKGPPHTLPFALYNPHYRPHHALRPSLNLTPLINVYV